MLDSKGKGVDNQPGAIMERQNHLHEEIVNKVKNQFNHGVIILNALKPGTVVVTETKNSTYHLVVVNEEMILIRGGRYWPKPVRARFQGSTWGTKMLWSNRIGFQMNMEITVENEVYRTSPVQSAQIFSPEGWDYKMEWN